MSLTNTEYQSNTFQYSNYLSNVLAVISNKRSVVCSGEDQIAYYEPEVLSANDYFAFGLPMEGRTYSSGIDYKYGFNGMEKEMRMTLGRGYMIRK